MYCPSCAASNPTGHNFCRGCGITLTDITAVYLEQIPAGTEDAVRSKERILEKFGQVAFGGLCVVVLAGIATLLYLIISRMILSGSNVWGGILLSAFIFFAAISLGYVFFRESIKDEKQKQGPARGIGRLTTQPYSRTLPDGAFESIAGVTEETTHRLPVGGQTREFH